MKNRVASSALSRPLIGCFLAGLVALAAATPAFAFNIGDVLAGVGAGETKRFSPTGTLLQTLNSGSGSSETTGMCFDGAGNLFATQFTTSTVAKFSPSGVLLTYPFGAGYANAESCVVDPTSGNLFFGQASDNIKKVSPAGVSLTTFTATTGPRGTDWIELGPDHCTIYYTSEGNLVRRFNVCTNTQLADFATLPASDCYANRLRPNGELMVACHTIVLRVSAAGTVLQTYNASGLSPAGGYLFALNLDPDNATFWTADIISGQIWRVNIGTGATVTSFNGGIVGGSLAGLAVVGEITGSGPAAGPIFVPTLQDGALVALSIMLAFFGLRARARTRR